MKFLTPALIKKILIFVVLVAAFSFLETSKLIPSAANAEDARVTKAMAVLKGETAYLGAPKIEGNDPVGGKDAPALYFGKTKMNNDANLVDKVVRQSGEGMVATLLVKGADEIFVSRPPCRTRSEPF